MMELFEKPVRLINVGVLRSTQKNPSTLTRQLTPNLSIRTIHLAPSNKLPRAPSYPHRFDIPWLEKSRRFAAFSGVST
jgi:hypothetical protein